MENMQPTLTPRTPCLWALIVFFLWGLPGQTLSAQTVKASNGLVIVTASPYNADNTGATDATAAIQRAIDDAYAAQKAVFVPSGTYLISNTLICETPGTTSKTYRPGHVLIGSSSGKKPVFKLADNAQGYNDAQQPKPIIHLYRFTNGRIKHNDNFNQALRGIDFDLRGSGHAGAVAVEFRACEGSAMTDVKINATGAFAGVKDLIGSGGSITNLEVIGGKYGIYAPYGQPCPVIAGLKLSGQTDYAVWYQHWTPLSIVGFEITKASGPVVGGMKLGSGGLTAVESSGNVSLVDGTIELTAPGDDEVAIANTDRSIYLRNVYFRGATRLVNNASAGEALRVTNSGVWSKVLEYSYCKDYAAPAKLIDGVLSNRTVADVVENVAAAPTDLVAKHVWPNGHAFCSFENPGVVSVKEFGAVGNGVADDTEAIQSAIDAAEEVFLPKGNYKVTKTIRLRANTKLFGLGRHISVVDGKTFDNSGSAPVPIFDTPDDAGATCAMANMKIVFPRTSYRVYPLRWRAGANSIVRDVWVAPHRVNSTNSALQRLIITGNGGGKFYNQLGFHNDDSNNPDYRHVLIDGTSQPLTFYMFHNQHIKPLNSPMAEIRNAANVTIFGLKCEETKNDPYPLRISDSENISIIGGTGLLKNDPLVEVINSTGITIANYARWGDSTSSYVTELHEGTTYTIEAPILSLFKRSNGAEVQSPYLERNFRIPSDVIEGEYYDLGGQGVAYNDDEKRNGSTSFRPDDGVDVVEKESASNGYSIGYSNSGEWVEYTVDVTSTGTYDITLTYSSGAVSPGDLQLSLDGEVQGTFTDISPTGGWDVFTTTVLQDVPLTAGMGKVLRLEYVNGAGFDIDALAFSSTNNETVSIRSEPLDEPALSIYPNPSNGVFELRLGKAGKVEVVNPTGQSTFQQSFPRGTHRMNLSHLPGGVYFLRYGERMYRVVLQ